MTELSGTFACPICGKDTPHHHSQKEVDALDGQRHSAHVKSASREADIIAYNDSLAAMDAQITSLQAQLEKAREALAQITENDGDGLHMLTPQAMQYIARAALGEQS